MFLKFLPTVLFKTILYLPALAHLVLPDTQTRPFTKPNEPIFPARNYDVEKILIFWETIEKKLCIFGHKMTSQIFQKLKTTGELIREAREKKGLLLRQVASYLEIDQALLSKIERGERKATRENIIKLASFLDLNEKEILVQFLSEKIAYDLQDEDVAKEALIVAEKKVAYLKSKKSVTTNY